jgi:hypothetical protein
MAQHMGRALTPGPSPRGRGEFSERGLSEAGRNATEPWQPFFMVTQLIMVTQ